MKTAIYRAAQDRIRNHSASKIFSGKNDSIFQLKPGFVFKFGKVTCGTGADRQCENKCLAGEWGSPGCPEQWASARYRTETCDLGSCPGLIYKL